MSDIFSIVKQIQSDIISPEIFIETILLKAKVLAHYLNNQEMKLWVKNELDGYLDTGGLPDYRHSSAALLGTFFNGYYRNSGRVIAVSEIHPDLRESFGKIFFPQGLAELREMAKNNNNNNLRNPKSGDWVTLYNRFNAEMLSHGHYQLIEAYYPIMNNSVIQVLSAVRSRLQDFILEISDLSWDMAHELPPTDKISKIFHITIYHNSGELNMSDIQQNNSDTYNVGQAGAVGRYARSDSNTFIQSEQTKTLVEAADEIQRLLIQLEQTNPTATQSEMIEYVSDETTPSLKRRASSALQACGEAAIDEFILEDKFLKVVKATIKAWLEADS
jgi:AbiTii